MLDKRLLKYDKILLSKADEAQRYCYPGLMKHIDFFIRQRDRSLVIQAGKDWNSVFFSQGNQLIHLI